MTPPIGMGSYCYSGPNVLLKKAVDMSRRAILFVNGPSPSATTLLTERIKEAAKIIAVDGGVKHCLSLNITPHLVVGDLDSAKKEHLEELRQKNVQIIKKEDQETTDLEYALERCVNWEKIEQVTVLGAIGGERSDHPIYHLKLLTEEKYAGKVLLDSPEELIFGLNEKCSEVEVTSFKGQQVSVYTLNAPRLQVTSQGLKWPLEGAPVSQSNESEGERFSLKVRQGDAICIVNKREKFGTDLLS